MLGDAGAWVLMAAVVLVLLLTVAQLFVFARLRQQQESDRQAVDSLLDVIASLDRRHEEDTREIVRLDGEIDRLRAELLAGDKPGWGRVEP